MCGIGAFFARESVPSFSIIDILFRWAEKRGPDGFGVSICRKGKYIDYVAVDKYSDNPDVIEKFYNSNMKLGDLLLLNCRAAPETEPPTSLLNVQPIHSENCVLVHNGAVSNKIYTQLTDWASKSGEYKFQTNIDSEAIIASYIKHGKNIKESMEFISGGVAALLYDQIKDHLFIISDFKPIAHSYIRGYGYFLASDNSCLREIVETITDCKRDGECCWESWYGHPLSGGRIKEFDLDSGFTYNIKYSPRYMTQSWDSNFTPKNDESLCLVCASGGLDSSLTLAMLKYAGYKNIVACHFNYGHRGSECEQSAITDVCNTLNIPLKVFDLSGIYSNFDCPSMLTDKTAKITTGTSDGLKKLDAWTPGRNMMFMTTMMTFAESEVMKNNYKEVYLLGGFLNLSESGHYCDNSEYFLHSMLECGKYGTLIGNRIKPLYGLANLMKSDLFYLIKMFKLEEVYKYTISCDRPKMIDGIACNCSKNGLPACGSGLLSYWGSKMCGMNDMELRNFYQIDEDYVPHRPKHLDSNTVLEKDIISIIDRILFPVDKLDNLKNYIKNIQ